LFPDLLNAGKSIYGWKVADNAYVLDIGTPSKYEQALRDWPLRMRRAIAHGVES
jgi:NDP-sugar pyrophosphorylase family protein